MAEAKGSWFMRVLGEINDLATRLELNDGQSQALREFILAGFKAEYMAGNRSGIRWARQNPTKTV